MVKCDKCVPGFSRRHFLRFSLGTGAGLAAASLPHSVLARQTEAAKRSGKTAKAVIMLWMGGGPTQYETFDPKPGTKNGGPYKAIDTSVPGVRFGELMPVCASQAKHMAVIRSMATHEGAHERGTSLMHIGTQPIQGLDIPSTGTVISYEKGDKRFPLPHFIAMDPPLIPQSTVFGEDYLPFRLNTGGGNPIPNINRNVARDRDNERAKLLLEQNKDWDAKRQQKEVAKVEAAYVKSEDVMNTPLLKAFNINEEPGDVRSAYGGRFGQNCLMARRLVQAGCSFVEIGLGGWDMHSDIAGGCKNRVPELDKGMGTLIKDLAEKDLLKETMVIWAGEFGRTPDVNGGNGRDHWANGFSVVLAGGGIAGGRVHGDTGPNGAGCMKPVSIHDFFATIYRACGIDWTKKYDTEGRKIKYVASSSAKPVATLF
jgi:hypothetical protein